MRTDKTYTALRDNISSAIKWFACFIVTNTVLHSVNIDGFFFLKLGIKFNGPLERLTYTGSYKINALGFFFFLIIKLKKMYNKYIIHTNVIRCYCFSCSWRIKSMYYIDHRILLCGTMFEKTLHLYLFFYLFTSYTHNKFYFTTHIRKSRAFNYINYLGLCYITILARLMYVHNGLLDGQKQVFHNKSVLFAKNIQFWVPTTMMMLTRTRVFDLSRHNGVINTSKRHGT